MPSGNCDDPRIGIEEDWAFYRQAWENEAPLAFGVVENPVSATHVHVHVPWEAELEIKVEVASSLVAAFPPFFLPEGLSFD